MGVTEKNNSIGKSIGLFFSLLYLLVNSNLATAQVTENDSLKVDSAKSELRVEIANENSKSYQPLDSLKSDTSEFLVFKKKKSPQRAALYSAILPGLGQAYNGKYWKIPIIYSIFTGMFFLARDNHMKYLDFKDAYINFDDNKPTWVSDVYQKSDLKDRKDYYKRNRDLNIIIGGLFYLLNILDANVDANLMYFDVGDDLGLNIQPDMNYFQANQKNQNISGFGIKFVLSLHK